MKRACLDGRERRFDCHVVMVGSGVVALCFDRNWKEGVFFGRTAPMVIGLDF